MTGIHYVILKFEKIPFSCKVSFCYIFFTVKHVWGWGEILLIPWEFFRFTVFLHLKKKTTKKQNLSFTISKAEVERRLKIETNMHIFGIFVMNTVSEIKPTDIKLAFRHFTVFQCSVPIGNTQLTKLPWKNEKVFANIICNPGKQDKIQQLGIQY